MVWPVMIAIPFLRNRIRCRRVAARAVLLSFCLVPAVPAVAGDLVPHRAGYAVSLGEVRNTRAIADVSGYATFTVERSCDAMVTNQQLVMQLNSTEGNIITQDLQYSAWESVDGKNYRFTAENRVNGGSEPYKGTARITGPEGLAVFSTPDNRHFPLPGDTLFPLGLTTRMIAAAEAGDIIFNGHLFDGSDGEGPSEITAFIAPKTTAADHGFAALGPLTDRPGWSIRAAFYPYGGKTPQPEYEVEVLQLDNGIQPRLILDHGDFTVLLTLKKVEALPAPDC